MKNKITLLVVVLICLLLGYNSLHAQLSQTSASVTWHFNTHSPLVPTLATGGLGSVTINMLKGSTIEGDQIPQPWISAGYKATPNDAGAPIRGYWSDNRTDFIVDGVIRFWVDYPQGPTQLNEDGEAIFYIKIDKLHALKKGSVTWTNTLTVEYDD